MLATVHYRGPRKSSILLTCSSRSGGTELRQGLAKRGEIEARLGMKVGADRISWFRHHSRSYTTSPCREEE